MKFKLDTQWMETNHRVREVTMGDGTGKFYPQRKMCFLVWRPIMDDGYSNPRKEMYHSLDDANTFLRQRIMEHKGNKIVKTEDHEFNLVFETLKQKNE